MGINLRTAEIVLAIAGATAFALSWVMNFWLWKTMPILPDVERGFAIPMINHGQTVYLTLFYDISYNGLFWGVGVVRLCSAN
jgi:hypothetical protein